MSLQIMEVNNSSPESTESKIEPQETTDSVQSTESIVTAAPNTSDVAQSTLYWNQNKKLPRMYPGIIFSGVASALSLAYLATGSATLFFFVLGWLALLIGSIYWTFCVFRISSLLQYKSSILKAVDRTLAIPISLI
jgi:hypothetical protein